MTNKYLYDLIVFKNSILQFSFKPSYYAEFRFRLLSNFSAVHRVCGIKIPFAFYAFSLKKALFAVKLDEGISESDEMISLDSGEAEYDVLCKVIQIVIIITLQ